VTYTELRGHTQHQRVNFIFAIPLPQLIYSTLPFLKWTEETSYDGHVLSPFCIPLITFIFHQLNKFSKLSFYLQFNSLLYWIWLFPVIHCLICKLSYKYHITIAYAVYQFFFYSIIHYYFNFFPIYVISVNAFLYVSYFPWPSPLLSLNLILCAYVSSICVACAKW